MVTSHPSQFHRQHLPLSIFPFPLNKSQNRVGFGCVVVDTIIYIYIFIYIYIYTYIYIHKNLLIGKMTMSRHHLQKSPKSVGCGWILFFSFNVPFGGLIQLPLHFCNGFLNNLLLIFSPRQTAAFWAALVETAQSKSIKKNLTEIDRRFIQYIHCGRCPI